MNICNENLSSNELEAKEELITEILKLESGNYSRAIVEQAIKSCCILTKEATFECVAEKTKELYIMYFK